MKPATATTSLFCANALRKPVEERIMPAFVRATGRSVDLVFDQTDELLQRIAAGALPSIYIGVSGVLEDAGRLRGTFKMARHIVSSGIGIAAATSVGAPTLTTVEELVSALTECRSVAYSRTRPSGTYFNQLLHDLGIAEVVNSRATFVEEGPTARALVDGRAALAVQQISELQLIPDVAILGPLPEAVQRYTRFSAHLCIKAANEYPATALFNFLASSLARSAYTAAGLQAY
ncbi:substrate-binding domain-containing protein [Arthrobacter sp. YC-RL1]|nr:substrate-binding domain-containing protein [Arthrobacter sp. YC-RL1]